MIEFKRKRAHSKKTRVYRKYPRAKVARLGGDRKAEKGANHFKNNWLDDNYTYTSTRLIRKFLRTNIGRPVDKVFSEFLMRCKPSAYSSPLKDLFYRQIEKKSEIGCHGGFYITNGILNYKKATHPSLKHFDYINYEDINANISRNINWKELALKATDFNDKVLIGKFWLGYPKEEKEIWMVKASKWTSDESESLRRKFRIAHVQGVGNAIYPFTYTSQSKLDKETYYPDYYVYPTLQVRDRGFLLICKQ